MGSVKKNDKPRQTRTEYKNRFQRTGVVFAVIQRKTSELTLLIFKKMHKDTTNLFGALVGSHKGRVSLE